MKISTGERFNIGVARDTWSGESLKKNFQAGQAFLIAVASPDLILNYRLL